jgi:hypothetical protein
LKPDRRNHLSLLAGEFVPLRSFYKFAPLCLLTASFGQAINSDHAVPETLSSYKPITAEQRIKWFAVNSLGPASLTGGLFSAGFGTLVNRPREYGPHWEGFGDRYGMRLTGVVTSNTMEASLGALWGEDPRYPRDSGQSFSNRIGHVVKWTFVARDRNGGTMPAYARYVATAGNNFLSNTWRESSEADPQHALERTALGFLARLSGNAFKEFWPDVKNGLFHRKSASAYPSSSKDTH